MLDLIVNSAITHSLLFVAPIACALLARWARCPGSGIVGGLVAGVLIGPTILGRSAPDEFERLFVGGVAERVSLQEVTRSHERERLVAQEARLEPEAIAEIDIRHERERDEATRAWRVAQWGFQRPMRSFTSAIAVLALLGAGLRRIPPDGHRIGLLAPASIGPWSAALPGSLAFLAVWQWGHGGVAAAMTAAAVAVGPFVLTSGDRAAADGAEPGGARTIERAGRIASLGALLLVGVTFVTLNDPHRAVWALTLLALPAGWLLPAVTRRTRVDLVLECALIPCLTTCVAIKLELYAHFAIWPIVVFVLLSGDGRWLGAVVGAMLAGSRRGLRVMRLVLGSMACGPTQLAVTAVAIHTAAVPERIALALLLGAVVIEVTAPMRRSMARRLVETEQELDG